METIKLPKMNCGQEDIFNFIVEGIISKDFRVGSRIPTEMELAKQFNTNRMNSHKALKHLENTGLIQKNRKGGTTVIGYPNTFTIGELRKKTQKTITILNPLPKETRELHWNEDIYSALKTGLRKDEVKIDHVDVSGIKTPAQLSEYFKRSAHGGSSAILFITYPKFNVMLENRPELFFNYQRNIFIFARDEINWSVFPYNIVSVDLFNEGVMAGEYSLINNYRKMFFGTTPKHKESSWLHSRREGLKCALRWASNYSDTSSDLSSSASFEEFYKCIENGSKTMLVCAADMIAIGFIDRVREEKGFQPGKDYGVISFNNDPRFKDYELTTIAPPLKEIGRTLADVIGKVLSGKDDRTTFIKIKSKLIKGRTS